MFNLSEDWLPCVEVSQFSACRTFFWYNGMCGSIGIRVLFVSQSTAALEWAQSSCKLINAEFASPSGTDWLLIQPLLSHLWREHFYPEISWKARVMRPKLCSSHTGGQCIANFSYFGWIALQTIRKCSSFTGVHC